MTKAQVGMVAAAGGGWADDELPASVAATITKAVGQHVEVEPFLLALGPLVGEQRAMVSAMQAQPTRADAITLARQAHEVAEELRTRLSSLPDLVELACTRRAAGWGDMLREADRQVRLVAGILAAAELDLSAAPSPRGRRPATGRDRFAAAVLGLIEAHAMKPLAGPHAVELVAAVVEAVGLATPDPAHLRKRIQKRNARTK